MKVLVTGVGGQLGHDVMNELHKRGHEGVGSGIAPQYSGAQDGSAVTTMPYIQLDITDAAAVSRVLREVKPDAVVHCAAWTAVDAAEEDEAACRQVNEQGTAHVAAACRKLGAVMIYISSDYVFSGRGERPWRPEDPCEPLSVYGRSKLAGEEAVRRELDRYFIVRTSWLYGKNGSNFVKTMLRLGQSGRDVRVVFDQVGAPTYTEDLARLLCDMAGSRRYGTYHGANSGCCSWYELAAEIYRREGFSGRVIPIASEEYPARALRPRNSRLDMSCLPENGFAPLPPWQEALGRFLKEWNRKEYG